MEEIKKQISNNNEIVWLEKKDLDRVGWDEDKRSIVFPKENTKLYIVNKEGEKIDLTRRQYGRSLGVKTYILPSKEQYKIGIIDKY